MQASFFAGVLSSLVLIVAIGAQNAFVLKQGIRREHVLPVVLICIGADLSLIFAGIAGLGMLLQNSQNLLQFTRYAGGAFLLAYGVLAARRAWVGEHLELTQDVSAPLLQVMLTCAALTFLNPHVYLDTVILLGTLANQHGAHGRWWFGLGAVAASFAWFFSLAYGARYLAPLFKQALAWRILDAMMALLMGGLAWNLLTLN
jgi:L-lysine exporter family protein LysE/ArgO